MSKYSPLGDFLRRQPMEEVPMFFHDIERVIGANLPPKAKDIRAWWSNNPSNNVMTKVWLDAGFQTERVDIAGKKLVFRRASPSRRAPKEEAPGSSAGDWLAELRGKLSGVVRFVDGVDLTAPTGEAWDAEA